MVSTERRRAREIGRRRDSGREFGKRDGASEKMADGWHSDEMR